MWIGAKMTSNRERDKQRVRQHANEADESQLLHEANVSSPESGAANSPSPSPDEGVMEFEEELVKLSLILKELRGVGKELKDFRKDNNQQLTDLKG